MEARPLDAGACSPLLVGPDQAKSSPLGRWLSFELARAFSALCLRCLSDVVGVGDPTDLEPWTAESPPPAEDRPAMMTKPGSQHEEVVKMGAL
jgi:hypothetical protein